MSRAIPTDAPAFEGRPGPPIVPDHDLLRCIGTGSYGEVWLARNVLGNWRAVKVVRRDHFPDAKPYEREFHGILCIEPISRSHEGLIGILHVGRREPEGYFYYVMELADDAEGAPFLGTDPERRAVYYRPRTLALELKRRTRLSIDECVQLGLTLSGALSQLHRQALSHRDVKPSNILYMDGVPKLGDIGLAGASQEAPSSAGTQGYVPPEGPGYPTGDLFGLGKVLYEAATGQDRLRFPKLPALPVNADERARLSELNEIWLRACHPSPERRYQTADELHADLALLHRGGSVRQHHRAAHRWRRAGVALKVALLVVGFASGALWTSLRQTSIHGFADLRITGPRRTEPKPVELDGFYNASLDTNWMHDFDGNDLASLPKGRHTFLGTPFEIRGLVQLRGAAASPYPARVSGIPIGRACHRLFFLHGTHWYGSLYQQIAAYVVHYADGTEREIPILFDQDIGSWWRDPQVERPGDHAAIAWTGSNLPASSSRHHDILALYKASWENPKPNLAIDRVDFVSSLTPCSPFLIAVTAE